MGHHQDDHCCGPKDHCDVEHHSSHHGEEHCPIERALAGWDSSMHHALHELKKDILKKKIQAKWGSHLEDLADVILEAKEMEWRYLFHEGKLKMTVAEKMAKVLCTKK